MLLLRGLAARRLAGSAVARLPLGSLAVARPPLGSLAFASRLSSLAEQPDTEASVVDHADVTIDGDLNGVDARPVSDFTGLARASPKEGGSPLSLPKSVIQFFRGRNYEETTPIQAQSLPLALAGRDLVGIAQTGSGKTMAFLIPLLWDAALRRRGGERVRGPQAVVLAPTRELAQQIHDEALPLARAFGCRTVCVFGGQRKSWQEREILRAGPRLDLVVGTPGRLTDLINDQTLRMHRVRFLVLDEADRMLDMGFEPQLREIAEEMPPPSDRPREDTSFTRQTLMFSATWPSEVRQLAMDFLADPLRVSIGGSYEDLVANADITQHVHMRRGLEEKKVALVEHVVAMEERMKEEGHADRRGANVCHTAVFVNRKRDAEMVADAIEREMGGAIRALPLHGDLTQMRRDRVREAVKAGRAQVPPPCVSGLRVGGGSRTGDEPKLNFFT